MEVVSRLRDAAESNLSLYGLWRDTHAVVLIAAGVSETIALISLVANFCLLWRP